METKTEQMSVSEEASVLSETVESTAATASLPESAAVSSNAEKKPQTRRTSRTTGRRKTAAESKNADETESEQTAKLTSETAQTSAVSDSSVSAVAEPETSIAPSKKAKTPRRKSVKTSDMTVKEKAEEISTEETTAAAEKQTKGSRKSVSLKKTEPKDPKSEKKEKTEKTAKAEKAEKTEKFVKNETSPIPVQPENPAPAAIDEPHAEEMKSPTEVKAKGTKKSETTARKKASTKKSAVRSEAEKSDQKTDSEPEVTKSNATAPTVAASSIEDKLAAMAKKAKKKKESVSVEQLTAVIPEASEKIPEVSEKSEEMENASVDPAPVIEHETVPEEPIDVSGTPHDTFFFVSPGQLAQMEAEAQKAEAETPATAAEETVALAAETETQTEELPTIESAEYASNVSEPETKTEEVSVPSESQSEGERRKENNARFDRRAVSQRRSDPHERDVMDKERVRANLFSVLGTAEALERRILIEETMKTIPLTDEERLDNHPTSLSNRVRSVIGSVLAEELSHGTIISSGRKLTLPTAIPKADDEEEPNDLIEDSVSYTDSVASETSTETPIEIEIEFVSEASEAETAAKDMKSISEDVSSETFEGAAEPMTPASAPIDVNVRDTSAVREPSIRRVRQPRGERTPRPQSGNVTAVIITEEELERVILNAVRRNSATKNDLFAVLKHVYVEPNRLSKEEENRIYGVAGNVLQKLVNRGTLQNADGRYLQKPSQRVLNPGRAPGAYSTGNVEARFITELNRQSGDFFEQFAARLLEKYFEMSNVRVDASYVVGGSDDNGIDIMIETTDWLGYKERVFVQAKKRATQPVTLKEVREFYGALCAEEGTRGVFITTSNFCMEASKMIGKLRNLIAIDKRKLFALAEHCEVGLIRDEEGRLLLDENLFLDYDV